MKKLSAFLLPLLLSCSGKQPVKTPELSEKQPPEKQSQLSLQPKDIETRQPSPLFDSLMNDFDLKVFFSDMQFTNNGGAIDEIYYFRPGREGFYYSYFGSPHYSGDIFGKLTVTTYIFGNRVGHYNEQDETLIEIDCRVKEPALGKLDLVGKPIEPFRRHSARVYASNQRIILQENEQLLELSFRSDTIRSFHYIRVKNHFPDFTDDEREALLN